MNIKERAAELSQMLQELYDEANRTGEVFSISFNAAYRDYDEYTSGPVGFEFDYIEEVGENEDGTVKLALIGTPDYGWYRSSCSW